MSKLGRRPILLGDKLSVKRESGGAFIFTLDNEKWSYDLPEIFDFSVEKNSLSIFPREGISLRNSRIFDIKTKWGLHRALINNLVCGIKKSFEKQIIIDGLGFKAQKQGKELVFSLGFSEKKTIEIPGNIAVEIDKTGQSIIVKSSCKMSLGQFCASIKDFRKVEPYKNKGIRCFGDIVRKKAGKTK